MAVSSGTVVVGAEVTAVCAVPESGIRVRNTGSARVFLGGPDVGTDGDEAGYPLDPGDSETLAGVKPRETPVVPAPEGDLDPAVLHACCEKGTAGLIAFIIVT